jgi:16S rRNA (cytosine967-C5)-methyltransferase
MSRRSGAPAANPRASARAVAFEALVAIEERPVFLRAVLDELCAAFEVDSRERGLALEIAAGVTRRRATLDALLATHLRAPGGRIEPRLRIVLRMGVYQLVFLATPPHAAVFEMVELARRQQPRWTRLVNGVLRAVQRDMTEEPAAGPQPNAVPVCSVDVTSDDDGYAVTIAYRTMQSSPFPSPEFDFARYVAAAFSLPDWLAARWEQHVGRDELVRLAAWFTTPGGVSLRVNRLRATRDALLDQLRSAGITAIAGGLEGAIRLAEHARVEQLPGFSDGLFSVQDESAQAATASLDPQPGQRVLDLCAAPGGKSAALAERMQDRGTIIAADTDAARVALIGRGAERLGLTIIEPIVVRTDSSDVPVGPFDRILLDVPCSNTGVLGKRPEARWRISESGIAELAVVQSGLLAAALDRLAIGGRLVYSTCSIEPEENEQIIENALAPRSDFRLVREAHYHPGRPGDGGYQALIERVG